MSLGKKFQRFKRFYFSLFVNSFQNLFPFTKTFFFNYKRNKDFNKILYKKKSVIKNKNNLDAINQFEFSITSQNNEDGLIEHIFSKIKNNRTFFEIGFEFSQSNTINLIKKGWKGTLVDVDVKKCADMKNFLKKKFSSSRIEVLNQFINKNNLNLIIKNKNIDFFSIDVDGNDYWVLKNLNTKNIKVICAEYNPFFKKKSVSIPYNSNFRYKNDFYFGASIIAIYKILKKKKFELIALDSSGTNAFFIKKKFKNNFKSLNPYKSFKKSSYFNKKKFNQISKSVLIKKLIKV